MTGNNLKEKLIDKIKETNDPFVLEEILHLLELQEPDTIYKVNKSQKKAIENGKEQIKNKQFLTNKQADKDIDEWLNG